MESQEGIGLDGSVFGPDIGLVVLDIQMGPEFVLGLEGYVALDFADLVGTDEVSLGEVVLKVLVLFVIDVFVVVAAQMAGQMLSIEVLEELQVTEEELFAEVAVRVRQHVSELVVADVTVLDVASQGFHVVQALLSDEHSPSFEADFAEGLFVLGLQVALQTLLGWELLVAPAVVNHASEVSEPHAGLLGLVVVVVDGLVFLVLLALAHQLLFEVGPLEIPVVGDNHLLQLSFADGALFVLHDESQPERAGVANVPVAADAQLKVGKLVHAQNAGFVAVMILAVH